MTLNTDAARAPQRRDAAVAAANAAAVGIAIDAGHLPLVAAGLAAVASTLATGAAACRFETEPALFVAMLDAHAETSSGGAAR